MILNRMPYEQLVDRLNTEAKIRARERGEVPPRAWSLNDLRRKDRDQVENYYGFSPIEDGNQNSEAFLHDPNPFFAQEPLDLKLAVDMRLVRGFHDSLLRFQQLRKRCFKIAKGAKLYAKYCEEFLLEV